MVITITVVEKEKSRLVDAFCARFNYDDKFRLADGTKDPGAPTRPEYAKKKVVRLIQDFIRDHETQEAMRLAQAAPDPNITEA